VHLKWRRKKRAEREVAIIDDETRTDSVEKAKFEN
jgi:hypothetical protein